MRDLRRSQLRALPRPPGRDSAPELVEPIDRVHQRNGRRRPVRVEDRDADRAGSRAREHIPHVDVEILREAGHAMGIEAAERVGLRVVEFLG